MPDKAERERLSREEIDRRFREFGLAAAKRLVDEMWGDGGAIYDMVEDADVVQLESPVPGGVRLEVRMERYGDEVLVDLYFYNNAAHCWQVGQSFSFSHEKLVTGNGPVDRYRDNAAEWLMEQDDYFEGMVSAVMAWNVVSDRVVPIEEETDDSELD